MLDLSECGLTEIPKEIANMTWLTHIDTILNKINDISPIQGLEKLTTIDFGSNQKNFNHKEISGMKANSHKI
jgi:Leucine-rich repeat (LRR) protein